MNSKKNGSIRYLNDLFTAPLRIITIFAVVISAYDVGRAILSFVEFTRGEGFDMLLVVLFLLPAPLTFASAFLLFYAAKSVLEGKNADMAVTIAFGLMVLSSISYLIAEASTLSEAVSLIVLCAIVLVCYVIEFLYYQGIGNRALAIFAGGMGLACAVYSLINGIILVVHEPRQIGGYLFTSYLAALMIALTVLMFILSLAPDNLLEEVDAENDESDTKEEWDQK